jgi:hypothetical protein
MSHTHTHLRPRLEPSTELQASGLLLLRVVQAFAAAMATVQRERIRPQRVRPLHRV